MSTPSSTKASSIVEVLGGGCGEAESVGRDVQPRPPLDRSAVVTRAVDRGSRRSHSTSRRTVPSPSARQSPAWRSRAGRRSRRRDCRRPSVSRRAPESTIVAGRQVRLRPSGSGPMRTFGPGRSTRMPTGPARRPRNVPDQSVPLDGLVEGAVGQADAEHVHAGVDHAAQDLGRLGGRRTDGGDDLGATGHDGTLSPARPRPVTAGPPGRRRGDRRSGALSCGDLGPGQLLVDPDVAGQTRGPARRGCSSSPRWCRPRSSSPGPAGSSCACRRSNMRGLRLVHVVGVEQHPLGTHEVEGEGR